MSPRRSPCCCLGCLRGAYRRLGLSCEALAARYTYGGIGFILFGSRLNFLLLACPLALISQFSLSEGFTFALSIVGMIPLAASLGTITEQLALHTNQATGGLINATLGTLRYATLG